MKNDLFSQSGTSLCCMIDSSTKKAIAWTVGMVAGITLLGVAAATVYNCKQMRAARALKRTGKILYMLGTTMRSVSGMEPLA